MSTELNRFRKNTYRAVVTILLIFGVTGTIGAVIGKYFDNQSDTFPRFTAIFMGISYVIGWVLAYYVKSNHDKQIKIIDKKINQQEE